MNILSLFDGMSCGQIALVELGIKYNKYYASEIDKHAIKQTQLNFPDTIQLGDIEDWKHWKINWESIDLILAGSPCTGFSFAGKQLNFADPQSRLFFTFVDIYNHVKHVNPNVFFLLENVRMKKQYLRVITEKVGIFPVLIDSALVSAQSRKRYYWSNIKTKLVGLFNELHTDIPQPEDRKIMFRDILEHKVDEIYYLKGKVLERILKKSLRIMPEKSYCLVPGFKEQPRSITLAIDTKGNFKKNQQKSGYLTGVGGHGAGNHSDMDLILQLGRGFNKGGLYKNKTPTISANSWEQNNFIVQLNQNKESGGKQPYQQNRVYSSKGKSPALMAELGGRLNINDNARIRRLTPVEYSRLQTIPEWYRWECSNTQIYKMCGNGWTVEVIMHIFSYLPKRFLKK